MGSLKFITPASGDWLVIEDADSGYQIYSGHGNGDEMWTFLNYLKVDAEYTEISDEEFQEKY